MHDIAVLDDIILAFNSEFACLPARGLTAESDEIFVLDDLGTDEPALEVRMDHTCALRRLSACAERPRAHLIAACGKERAEVKQGIRRLDEPVNTRLLQTYLLEEHLALLVSLQFGYLALDLSCYDEHLGLFVLDGLAHLLNILIATDSRSLIDIANVEHRFGGEQEQVMCRELLVFVLQFDGACRLALRERIAVTDIQVKSCLRLFVATHAHLFFDLLYAALDGFQILELKFGIDHLLVAYRVDRTINMDHIAVVKATKHMDDGVRLADVSQELVAKPLAVAGPLDQSGYIDYLHRSGYDAALGVAELAQTVQTLVGNGDHTEVRFDSTEGKIGGLRLGVAQTVKQSGFAHVRQSYYTAL